MDIKNVNIKICSVNKVKVHLPVSNSQQHWSVRNKISCLLFILAVSVRCTHVSLQISRKMRRLQFQQCPLLSSSVWNCIIEEYRQYFILVFLVKSTDLIKNATKFLNVCERLLYFPVPCSCHRMVPTSLQLLRSIGHVLCSCCKKNGTGK